MVEPLLLKGAPGSPYTRKMLAYMRYRHIAYRLMIGDQGDQEGRVLPQPKVSLLPTFYLPNSAGELEAVVDSTPLIRRFESMFTGRETVPSAPALRLLHDLIEDYADEWLTKAMFHYRWHYADDIEKAGLILPLWRDLNQSAAQLEKTSEFIRERQISRLYVVGSNEATWAAIEASYERFLTAMDELVEAQSFLFGARPSAADFGLYAQLTQLAGFDPTPQRLCLQKAPRVYAWVDVVDDLSGLDVAQDWPTWQTPPAALRPLLEEVGRVYPAVMLANAEAIAQGESTFVTEILGETWEQPVFVYQARCLKVLRTQFDELAAPERDQFMAMIEGTGCEDLFLNLKGHNAID
jgi:glutathione S-transferase